MTTLIGIKAEKGLPGVILGTDLSRTQDRWTPQGDVAYRQQTRSEGQKVYVDKDREVAVCMSGIFDQPYVNFLSAILNKEINVREAIKREFFDELRNLNLDRWGGRIPQPDYMNALLMATRFDNKPELYTCFPLGRLEKREWTSIGSGSSYALSYIAKQGRLIPRGIDLTGALDLTVKSLDEAAQDIYTGGLDIAVIRPEGIAEYGQNIKSAIDNARGQAIDQIKEKLGALK